QQALAARQAEAGSSATQDSMPIWPWAIGVLLVIAALVWLLVRRKAAAPRRPAFDASRLAASVPSPVSTPAPAPAPAPAPSAPAAAPVAGAPTWHSGNASPAAPVSAT